MKELLFVTTSDSFFESQNNSRIKQLFSLIKKVNFKNELIHKIII